MLFQSPVVNAGAQVSRVCPIAERNARRQLFSQASAKSGIQNYLEWLVCFTGNLDQAVSQIVVCGESGPHADIMMHQHYDVKMPEDPNPYGILVLSPWQMQKSL